MGIRRFAYMSFSFDDVERGFGDAKDGKERLPGESWEYLVGYDAVLDGKSFNQAMDEAEAGWDKEEAMYGRGGMNSGYGPTTITPNSSRKIAETTRITLAPLTQDQQRWFEEQMRVAKSWGFEENFDWAPRQEGQSAWLRSEYGQFHEGYTFHLIIRANQKLVNWRLGFAGMGGIMTMNPLSVNDVQTAISQMNREAQKNIDRGNSMFDFYWDKDSKRKYSSRKTAGSYNFPTVTNAQVQKFKKMVTAIGYMEIYPSLLTDDYLHDILLANGGFKKAMDKAGIVNDAYNDARGAGGLEIEDGWGLSVLIETTDGGDVVHGTGGYISYSASSEDKLALLDAIAGKYRSESFVESAQQQKEWILEEMNKTSSRKTAGVEDLDRWNSLWKCDECWRKETMYHPDTGQVDEAESRGWVVEYDDNEDIDWVLCPDCAPIQKNSSRKTSATSGEVEAIIGKFDGDHRSRVQAMADLMEYGPNYNRSVTEHVLTAMRFQGDEREWFVRRAEAQANLARTGEWLPPIHPSESGQQLTLDIESSLDGSMCEQKCGRTATVIASSRSSQSVEGQYCRSCANALNFRISRRKINS